MFTCTSCKAPLPASAFGPSKTGKNGYASHCRKCKSNATRALKRKKQIQVAGRAPGRSCEICGFLFVLDAGQYFAPHWDHSHVTGKFRGWLCFRCNIVLGYYKDNPQVFQQFVTYLQDSVELEEALAQLPLPPEKPAKPRRKKRAPAPKKARKRAKKSDNTSSGTTE